MKIPCFVFTIAAALALALTAHAAELIIPSTTVLGTEVFSGPSFTVSGNFGVTDFVSVEATGTVDLASGLFTANAAGVITAPALTNTGNAPGQTATGPAGFPFASLLIGNLTLGFHPLFPADASTGLGSPSAPTDIFATRTLGDIFGAPIGNGTVLELRVNDSNTGDNSGSFLVHSVTNAATAPERWSLWPSILLPLALWSGLILVGKHLRAAQA
jgi:hypothetical protein